MNANDFELYVTCSSLLKWLKDINPKNLDCHTECFCFTPAYWSPPASQNIAFREKEWTFSSEHFDINGGAPHFLFRTINKGIPKDVMLRMLENEQFASLFGEKANELIVRLRLHRDVQEKFIVNSGILAKVLEGIVAEYSGSEICAVLPNEYGKREVRAANVRALMTDDVQDALEAYAKSLSYGDED